MVQHVGRWNETRFRMSRGTTFSEEEGKGREGGDPFFRLGVDSVLGAEHYCDESMYRELGFCFLVLLRESGLFWGRAEVAFSLDTGLSLWGVDIVLHGSI